MDWTINSLSEDSPGLANFRGVGACSQELAGLAYHVIQPAGTRESRTGISVYTTLNLSYNGVILAKINGECCKQ